MSKFTNKIKSMVLCDSTINEVLFYGADSEQKKQQLGLNNLLSIYYLIIHANQSIDVCLPTLASETIKKCLISVQEKNVVKIRIAIHSSDEVQNFELFASHGIDVKIMKSTVKLEHEFVLIDASDQCQDAVAIIGSLDYDISRVNFNRNATVITSEPNVNITLRKEFDRIWNTDE